MSNKNKTKCDIARDNLVILRKSLGINQTDMGEKLGLSQNNYSDVERGRVKMRDEFLIDLSEKFGVSLNWLLLNEGPMLLKDISPRFGVNSESTTNHPTAEFNQPIPAARTNANT